VLIMKVYILESSTPFDFTEKTSEAYSLKRVCQAMGHDVGTFYLTSKIELKCKLQYLSTIGEIVSDEPVCVHISAHGNSKGLAFGKDFINWRSFVKLLKPILTMDYEGKIILIISA